ncbi:YheT family hydrolase [Parvibium lacunae]|uniref:Alpha/beta fold hydrolase n=1 Tax=Parvibium lacunae TaxID=1888893 RepID=A0A368KZI9_9BURK|nr:alpha/beta fold hydrolase [Parvibium lacunae]RCS56730.1 alpha/beta fold hydrolase [Parvibium lacunae]
MPHLTSTYRPPAWLPGGHAQTIYAALWAPRPTVAYQRVRWELPDGDFIDVDQLPEPATTATTAATTRPLVVLFHGLEGSSKSHYARALMAVLAQAEWGGWVIHFRGCSGELNRLPRAYHSGDSDEIANLLARVRQAQPQRPIFAVGVSLGGNALLKTLGERPLEHAWLRGAAAVSAPVDLQAGAEALAHGINRLYTRNFLQTLKAKTRAKLAHYPGLVDAEALAACRNFHDFDALVTAPLHGFRDAYHYWQSSASKPWLHAIRCPTLVLNARNDSFLPAHHLPLADAVSPQVWLEQPAHGGHVGFVAGAYPGHLQWLPQRLLQFFQDQLHG